jgi:uncharacterized membrane protein
MEKTYLAIVAILALATAAALTPVAISQQVFAQDSDLESETETSNKAKNKCAASGFSSCEQTATSTLTVGAPGG